MGFIKIRGVCIIKQTHQALPLDYALWECQMQPFGWFICVTYAVIIRGSGIIGISVLYNISLLYITINVLNLVS